MFGAKIDAKLYAFSFFLLASNSARFGCWVSKWRSVLLTLTGALEILLNITPSRNSYWLRQCKGHTESLLVGYGMPTKLVPLGKRKAMLMFAMMLEDSYQRWSRGHKARGQGHKKKSEAKAKDSLSEDKHSRGQGQGPRTQAQVLSKKKRPSQKFFRLSPKKKKKKSSQKFFKRSPRKNIFQKIFQALHKILTIQNIVLSSSRGQANFRRLEASRPRPRTSKCVLEAKDVLEDSTSDSLPLLQMPADRKKKAKVFERNFECQIMDKKNAIRCESVLNPNTVKVYTDGKKLNGRVDVGFYADHSNNSLNQAFSHLGIYSTVFQAEVLAISKVAKNLLLEKMHNQSIVVLVDSQAAIKAPIKFTVKSITMFNYIRNLNQLGKQNQVSIACIHSWAQLTQK